MDAAWTHLGAPWRTWNAAGFGAVTQIGPAIFERGSVSGLVPAGARQARKGARGLRVEVWALAPLATGRIVAAYAGGGSVKECWTEESRIR